MGSTFACGGHVEGREALSDVIEILADGRFLLHGRDADLVNIAGKRTSLAYLNHQIDGHRRGSGRRLLPAGGGGSRRHHAPVRLRRGARTERASSCCRRCANVSIRSSCRGRCSCSTHLPRNGIGKLPRERLQALYAADTDARMPAAEFPWPVPADHPAFAGHFPGRRSLPGVVLVDRAILFADQLLGRRVAAGRSAMPSS